MRTFMIAPAIAAGLAMSASAQVSNFIGNLVEESAPSSLEMQAYESSDHISLISETTNHILASDLKVNAVGVGLFDSTGVLSPATIPAGTKVNSWILHSDDPGVVTDWAMSLVLGGGVTFDQRILGVIALDSELDASDAEVGADGTTYAASDHRGMELDLLCPTLKYDAFTLSADEHSISMIMHTDRKMDEIRVITEAIGPVPAPGAAGLLAGFGLLASRRRR